MLLSEQAVKEKTKETCFHLLPMTACTVVAAGFESTGFQLQVVMIVDDAKTSKKKPVLWFLNIM